MYLKLKAFSSLGRSSEIHVIIKDESSFIISLKHAYMERQLWSLSPTWPIKQTRQCPGSQRWASLEVIKILQRHKMDTDVHSIYRTQRIRRINTAPWPFPCCSRSVGNIIAFPLNKMIIYPCNTALKLLKFWT